ncbi:MAG: HAD family phosphatase [Ignavibacteria bacterium]|nr:HAD family phosphatase [Ignavibacteria bacterium]
MTNGTAQLHDTFHGIKNIIFDLGGVLYNVDYSLVEKEFATLQKPSSTESKDNTSTPHISYTRQTQPEIFSKYEIGAVSTTEFCEGLRKELGLVGSDEELSKAWNSMLLGVYPGRNALIWRLKQHYSLALLSNTNEAHIEHVKPECQELFSLFEKLFYSYQMGLRKPDTAIFNAVVQTMHYEPSETLFIDDSHQHIEAARACGLRTLWLQHPDSLELIVDLLAPVAEKEIVSE